MVDSTRDIVKHDILVKYVQGLDQCPDIAAMVAPTIQVMKLLHQTILTDHRMYLSTIRNPQEELKQLKDEVYSHLTRL